MSRRLLPPALVISGAALLVGLFFVLRPADEAERTPAVPATTAETGEVTVTVLEPPVRVVVRDGRPLGGVATLVYEQGDRIRLVVEADVADHVHVHGYDVMRDVAPGKPARIQFRATIAGRFEVELEDAGLRIAELEVRP